MVEDRLTAAERSYDAELRSHRHDFHQVLFPSLGQMSLRFGVEPGFVGKGRLAFVAAGANHGYRANGPNCVLVAHDCRPIGAPRIAAPATPMGATMGRPDDLGQQTRILLASLRLMETATAPGQIVPLAEMYRTGS